MSQKKAPATLQPEDDMTTINPMLLPE